MSDDKTTQETNENETNQATEETVQEDLTQEEELQAKLDQALEEAAKYKDEYVRTHADFENSKKRLEKEKATAVSFANEKFATDMLGIIDSLESALDSAKQAGDDMVSIQNFIDGIELTREQAIKAFAMHNVKPIECEGEFDPNLHQVIMQVDSPDHETGHIVTVMQKGYTIKDRVLRPAMVSTAK